MSTRWIVPTLLLASVSLTGCGGDEVSLLERLLEAARELDEQQNNPGSDQEELGVDGEGEGGVATACVGGEGFAWSATRFEFPADELSCDGDQLVRYDDAIDLFVGLTLCSSEQVRVYLAEREAGPYLPATDWAGHGQDHCELVNPDFTMTNDDDINSGSCSTCATSYNLPLEGVPSWSRGYLGEAFEYDPSSPTWAYQTSRLSCGIALAACSAAGDDEPAPAATLDVGPRSTPCGDGAQLFTLAYDISASEMANGASSNAGPGVCVGEVQLHAWENESACDGDGNCGMVQYNASTLQAPGCGGHHCGTLYYADGRVDENLCTIYAACVDGEARGVAYSW